MIGKRALSNTHLRDKDPIRTEVQYDKDVKKLKEEIESLKRYHAEKFQNLTTPSEESSDT
jgi:hypothetical protein